MRWSAFGMVRGTYLMENKIEIWKTIDGFEDYQISNFGRVKSFKKYVTNERILLPRKNKDGYLQLDLCQHGKQKRFKIHILVAIYYKGHVPDGTMNVVVDHDDNNPLNNHEDNIKLISNRENCSKDVKEGTSQYVGVYFRKDRNKWVARIQFKGRQINLGMFKLEIEAKNAYDKALNEWKQGLDLNILYPKKVQK